MVPVTLSLSQGAPQPSWDRAILPHVEGATAMSTRLGIDIGGTGIKGAPVDTAKGELIAPRFRIPTPHPATPDAVARVVAEVAAHFDWTGAFGAAFPAVVKGGIVHTAANIDRSWIGADARRLLSDAVGAPGAVVNDADAAGIAEMEFGAGRGRRDTVVVVTIGTGIGTAVFTQGALVPNSELGHLHVRGKEAERRASDSVRERKHLSWKEWAHRLEEYFHHLEALLQPDLLIVGGGVSKKHDRFLPFVRTQSECVPAQLQNEAGIVGAAVMSSQATEAT
jgi:polyphosphate glucokinase